MFDFLADVVGGMLGSAGTGSNRSKALAAYKTAWNGRSDGKDSLDALMSSMKTKNVYGIYSSPEENPELAPYFAAWAAAIRPKDLRTYVRQSRVN